MRRIFTEDASGVSPIKIAAQFNEEGIPSPAVNTKRATSGHWVQNTVNGNPSRATGILNDERYIGCRIWNRLLSGKLFSAAARSACNWAASRASLFLGRSARLAGPCPQPSPDGLPPWLLDAHP
ncbi:recombinase family protein [Pseudophaeobacter leonis]|uniref:recombinase family protein n=1 Tax=Pseudophaeobacter leonis TaxID=1144477 RepID=UPI0009F2BBB3|nr:recombinase family protein [Pseudophaeobacter leonis]